MPRMLNVQLADIAWLKLLGVKDADFFPAEQEDENGVRHEVDLVDLLIATIIAIEIDRSRLIVHETKLDDLVPSDSHQGQSPFALAWGQPIAPVNGWHRLFLADSRSFNGFQGLWWELLHLNDGNQVGRTVGCNAGDFTVGRVVAR